VKLINGFIHDKLVSNVCVCVTITKSYFFVVKCNGRNKNMDFLDSAGLLFPLLRQTPG
jgi:hypothetical protein